MQQIVRLPDIDIQVDYFHIRIKNCKVEAHCGSYGLDGTHGNVNVPLSMFLMEACKQDWEKEFFAKLESEGLYDTFAEHCATEIEEHNTLLAQLPSVEEYTWWKPFTSIVDVLDNDKMLKRYRSDHWKKRPKCYIFDDFIGRSGRYMKTAMKKESTEDILIDIFRKSGSFEELRRKVIGPDGFESHITKLAEKCITPKLGVFRESARKHMQEHDTNDPAILVPRRLKKKLEKETRKNNRPERKRQNTNNGG